MDRIVNGAYSSGDAPAFHLVSHHDTNVMRVLAYLDPNNFEDHHKKFPKFGLPYASFISFELHRLGGDYFMRFVTNGKTLTFDGLPHNEDGLVKYQTAKEWLTKRSFLNTQYDYRALKNLCGN